MFSFLTPHMEVGIQNAIWAAHAWAVAVLFGWYLWSRQENDEAEGGHSWVARMRRFFRPVPGSTELALGIFLVAAWTGVQRTYWWGWRWSLSHADAELAQWFVDTAWLLWVPVAGILIGYTYHIHSRLKLIFGARWWYLLLAWDVAFLAITVAAFGSS